MTFKTRSSTVQANNTLTRHETATCTMDNSSNSWAKASNRRPSCVHDQTHCRHQLTAKQRTPSQRLHRKLYQQEICCNIHDDRQNCKAPVVRSKQAM